VRCRSHANAISEAPTGAVPPIYNVRGAVVLMPAAACIYAYEIVEESKMSGESPSFLPCFGMESL
jgi:hypothetical protein